MFYDSFIISLSISKLIFCQNGDVRSLADVKPRITEESNDKSKVWKLTELSEPNQCRSLRLPENLRATKVQKSANCLCSWLPVIQLKNSCPGCEACSVTYIAISLFRKCECFLMIFDHAIFLFSILVSLFLFLSLCV